MSDLSPPLAEPWPEPSTDPITRQLVFEAAADLAAARSVSWLGYPATEIHLYASLLAQVRTHLAASIRYARETESDLDWGKIAHLAGTTTDQARQLAAHAPEVDDLFID